MENARIAIKATLAQVKALLSQEDAPRLSEADTKANFIEPIIAALGWTGIGVVTREYYVKNSQEFIDYLMTGPGGRLLAIEAKSLQSDLTDKFAAQLIQYCAVEGIEWAALTNGRELQFFNTFLKPDLTAKRILSLDLLAFNNDAEYDALFEQVWQLSWQSMTTPTGVRMWFNQRRLDASLRTILLDSTSPIIKQLRKSLADMDIKSTPQELNQWFRSRLGTPITAIPAPAQHVVDAASLSVNTVEPNLESQVETADRRDKPFDPNQSETFAGSRRTLLPLFDALKRAVDQRLPEARWRSRKYYVAAESNGRAFLAVMTRKDEIVLGLALPPCVSDPRLCDDSGGFGWPRFTKVAHVSSGVQIDDSLVEIIAEAAAFITSGVRTSTHYGVTLRDLVNTGWLRPGSPLILSSGNDEVARATVTASGEIEWQGHLYSTPSDQSFARLLSRKSLNGWVQWNAELPEGNVSLAELRKKMMSAIDDRQPQSENNASRGF